MHFNSPAHQCDGFTPGRRVFGRTPKMPIGAAGNPFYNESMNPADSLVARARRVLAELREIQKDSQESDFNGKPNLSLRHQVWGLKSEQVFLGKAVTFIREMGNKADFKWQWRVIIIGRFGRKGPLIYVTGNSVEVDLNDLTPSNKISDVIGCGETLHLHLTKTKCHIRSLVDCRKLGALTKIRNEISQNNKTTCAYTDTMLGHNLF